MGDSEKKNPEGELQETDAAVKESQKTDAVKGGVPMRTYLIMILAGVYVAYLGVSLCQNVIKGVDGSNPGFLAAGIIFIVLGVVFVINGIRGSLKVSKAQKEQETGQSEQKISENVEEASDAAEIETESNQNPGKKMSLADRANLVSRMGDVNEDEDV